MSACNDIDRCYLELRRRDAVKKETLEILEAIIDDYVDEQTAEVKAAPFLGIRDAFEIIENAISEDYGNVTLPELLQSIWENLCEWEFGTEYIDTSSSDYSVFSEYVDQTHKAIEDIVNQSVRDVKDYIEHELIPSIPDPDSIQGDGFNELIERADNDGTLSMSSLIEDLKELREKAFQRNDAKKVARLMEEPVKEDTVDLN